MIKLQVIGNLGGDAEIREVNGKRTINFSVAHSEKFTDKNGNKVESTTWVRCTIWREGQESVKVAEFLKKGVKVFVEGAPTIDTYENNQRKVVASLNLRVDRVELLSSLEKPAPGAEAASTVVPPVTVSDGTPF